MNKNIVISIGAVLAGFFAVIVLSAGTDARMHAAGEVILEAAKEEGQKYRGRNRR